MATTYAPTHIAAEPTQAVRPGFLGRMLAHMMRAREMEAKRRIATYSYLITDEDLDNIGLTRRDIAGWHQPHGG